MNHENVWIILPVYNESPSVFQPLISSLLSLKYQVVVIDDGSKKEVKQTDTEVLIRHSRNLGQGAALSTGMKYVRNQNAACVVHMDSDGQHQVSDLAGMIAPILKDEADIVIGSRFRSVTSIQSVPVLRRWTLRFARIVNTWFTGMSLSDAHNGFRAVKPHCLPHLCQLLPGREHASQIVFIANQRKWRLREIPVIIRYETEGKSQRIHWTELIRLITSLCRYRLLRYQFDNPELTAVQAEALLKVHSS